MTDPFAHDGVQIGEPWHRKPTDLERRLIAENDHMRRVLAEANNFWRHEFDSAVGAAVDTLFRRLSGNKTLPERGMTLKQGEPTDA